MEALQARKLAEAIQDKCRSIQATLIVNEMEYQNIGDFLVVVVSIREDDFRLCLDNDLRPECPAIKDVTIPLALYLERDVTNTIKAFNKALKEIAVEMSVDVEALAISLEKIAEPSKLDTFDMESYLRITLGGAYTDSPDSDEYYELGDLLSQEQLQSVKDSVSWPK